MGVMGCSYANAVDRYDTSVWTMGRKGPNYDIDSRRRSLHYTIGRRLLLRTRN